MKPFLLAALFLPTVLLAQNAVPQPPVAIRRPLQMPGQPMMSSEPLADNYQLSITINDKEGAPSEMSIVVASNNFNSSFGEQGISFTGSLALEEGGGLVITYGLGWETAITANGNTQYKNTSLSGSVHLKLGEEVIIIRTGNRTIKLSAQKLGK